MQKNVFLYILLSVISVLLISSCMGEEGRVVSVANQPGVVIKDATETVVQLRDLQIYSDKFGSTVDNGDCLLFEYKIDFDLLSDTAKNEKKFKAEILRTDTVHREDLRFVTGEIDTLSLLPNELRLSNMRQGYTIIRNQFFLYTQHANDSLHKSFNLIYYPESAPVVEDGKRIHHLYLRVQGDPASGKLAHNQTIYVNAFNIKDLLEKETNDTVYFKIKYPNSFNKDTTEVSIWSTSSLFKYPMDPVQVEE